MMNSTIIMFSLTGFILVLMVFLQGFSRKVDLFSMRNMYLFSFLVYQIISPATALYTENFTLFQVNSPAQSGKQLLIFVWIYLAVFLLSYHRLGLTPWVAKKFSGPPRETSDSFFLGLAVALVVIALPLRLFGPGIPLIAKASANVSIALASVACGLAGWVWSNRRLNIPIVLMVLFIVGSSFAISLIGVFGRRFMLSVLVGFAWGVYHRRMKWMNPGRMLLNIAPVMLVVFVAVSAFTAIRDNRKTAEADIRQTMAEMQGAQIDTGAKDVFSGQTTGSATLWALENYPDPLEPQMLYSLKFMAYWYIPSAIWPEKPTPLGNHIATLAKVDGVHRELITLPPGVIGYAAAEGGLIAVIVYALFYGQFLRLFDEFVRLNPTNAFVLLPVGCATGQVLGLARGDIAVFANLILVSFISTYFLMYLVKRFFGKPSAQAYWVPAPQPQM